MENANAQHGSPDGNKPNQTDSYGDAIIGQRSQIAEAANLVRNAMDYVRELIRVNEGRWSFYRDVNASLLERWLKDDHPNLHRCVIRIGAYDVFKEQLLEYCGKFSAATALAEMYLRKYLWSLHYSLITPFGLEEDGREVIYGPSGADTESYFPGVARHIENGSVGRIEDLPTMVALLVDRFLRLRHTNRHSNARVALNTRLTESCTEWGDLKEINEAPRGTAFTITRQMFSSEMYDLTPERYALVVNMPANTSVDSLVQDARVTVRVDCRSGKPEQYLALSMGAISIPVMHNEELLLKFRKFIPIVFLLGQEMLLVEYEWSPTAFGSDFIADVQGDEIQARDIDSIVCGATVTEKAGDVVVISDVRAMPVLPGTPERFTPDYLEPVWDDSIPF